MSSSFSGKVLTSLCLCFVSACSDAATLHGRIKDQRCEVMSQVTVRIRPTQGKQVAERTLNTDNSGNYVVDLPAGEYQLCVQRGAQAAPACTGISLLGKGDAWITTQLRDTTLDLSRFGNHAE